MFTLSIACLVAASLVLVGALGVSIYQRKSAGYKRWAAVSYILYHADEGDLEVLEFFSRIREIELLIEEGTDK